MSSAILGRFSGVGWTFFWFHFVYSLPVSFLFSLLCHSLYFLFVLLSFSSITLCPYLFYFLLPLLSFGICLLPGAASHLPSILLPNNFLHLSAFPILFLSPLCVSLFLPFYFHFLLNSISLGSSFLPLYFLFHFFLWHHLPTSYPPSTVPLTSIFLSSLHLVFSLLPCFHLIMSPCTSCFPFIFPSVHPLSVLLSSLLSFMSCSFSL